jgi:hypothetical protein
VDCLSPIARFKPEPGMTQAEVRLHLGPPQRIDGAIWRYYPFDVGGDRFRLNLTFDAKGLTEWDWQTP